MQRLFLRHAAVPVIAATIVLVTIATALAAVDAFSPTQLPTGFSSSRQLLGFSVNQRQFFEQVLDALDELRVPYMITGSVGAILFGEPRLTNDMDS